MSGIEQRLEELESRQAFQDNLVEELNDVVARQDQLLTDLTRRIALLEQRMADLADAASAVGESGGHEVPPHY